MSTAPAAGGSHRVVLALIAGIPLTMILAASWLWYFVVEGDLDIVGAIGTANNGTLLDPPRYLAEMPFKDDAGATFGWTDLEPRWALVVVNRGDTCDTLCERQLYFTRQIHIALGREFNRARRILITDMPTKAMTVEAPAQPVEGWPTDLASDQFDEYLTRAHQGLVSLSLPASDVSTLFPDARDPAPSWYLVDRAGWVMMRFDNSLDYKAVLSDLKFLIKHSGGV